MTSGFVTLFSINSFVYCLRVYSNKEEYRTRLEKLISAIDKEIPGVDVIGETGRPSKRTVNVNVHNYI